VSDVSELRAVIETVATALQREKVTYFITGSLASSIHGEFRATNDVDIVADLKPHHLPGLLGELSGEFITDLDQARAALDSGTSFNLIHRQTYLKVDVFLFQTALDREAARRAVEIVMPGGRTPLRVLTKEDILLAKLRWYRLGGEVSEVQQRDIESLVAMNRDTLDRVYLDSWSNRLGLRDLLKRFWE